MEQYVLMRIAEAAAELGATQALIQTGRLKPYLSKAEASRLYGRNNIERWVDEGLLAVRKDGNHSAAWRIDRLELELIVKARFLLKHL
jgi:hypothetical protein